MISASILLNPAPVAPVPGGVEAGAPATTEFGSALAAAQAGTESDTQLDADASTAPGTPALAMLSGLMAGDIVPGAQALDEGAVAADGDASLPVESSDAAAAILAQMLTGPATTPVAQEAAQAPVAQATQQATTQQAAAIQSIPTSPKSTAAAPASVPAARGLQSAAQSGVDGDDPEGSADAPANGREDLRAAVAASTAVPDALQLFERLAPEPAAQNPSTAAPQAGGAQIAVQTAATALREGVATTATPMPVHAALREPVGTARWADELGNRLVLMSVRGQQQGSLTLTPEHLGPMEVQISVHRDTANVWFGAQHAETRAALAEAMPRLRELLASSGLSLGQSGVSEQAPREGFARASAQAVGGTVLDADVPLEAVAPAWRVWRPGLIDTYA